MAIRKLIGSGKKNFQGFIAKQNAASEQYLKEREKLSAESKVDPRTRYEEQARESRKRLAETALEGYGLTVVFNPDSSIRTKSHIDSLTTAISGELGDDDSGARAVAISVHRPGSLEEKNIRTSPIDVASMISDVLPGQVPRLKRDENGLPSVMHPHSRQRPDVKDYRLHKRLNQVGKDTVLPTDQIVDAIVASREIQEDRAQAPQIGHVAIISSHYASSLGIPIPEGAFGHRGLSGTAHSFQGGDLSTGTLQWEQIHKPDSPFK